MGVAARRSVGAAASRRANHLTISSHEEIALSGPVEGEELGLLQHSLGGLFLLIRG